LADYLARARAMIAHLAAHLQADLSVQLWNGEVLPLGAGARDDIRIVIASPEAIGRLVRSPKLMTLFEVYMSGGLDIVGGDPLQALNRWDHLRALGIVKAVDRKLMLRLAWPFLFARGEGDKEMSFGARVFAAFGRGRDDTAMIQFHYDVSNAFYALFLDPEMQYSSAVFPTPETSLADAQKVKMDLICRKLALKPGDRMLDLGCGWGGLACHAAEHFGATVHGVTLSQAQMERAKQRVAERGLEHLVTIELRDYRTIDTPGAYDKIAQIGMFEHVGIDNHDLHYQEIHRLLAEHGLYLHQATTRRATRDLSKFRTTSAYMKVIHRYIFPGVELDYVGMTCANLERFGFEVRDVETMREHYYWTLKAWTEALYAHREAAIAEAGAERTRLWLLYLAMSAAGFWRGVLCDFQTLAQKRRIGLSGLPLIRDYNRSTVA
jgi:cyclopropane-fatty-acyl-phospholipid synthase